MKGVEVFFREEKSGIDNLIKQKTDRREFFVFLVQRRRR